MERLVRVAVFLVVAMAWWPHRANACGDYCGDWGALYYTGGYNLFNFGMDLYSAENFAYTDYGYGSWGGGCGGYTSSCTSAYDSFSYQVVIDTYTTLSGMCGISCGGGTDPFGWLNTYSPWTPTLTWNDWSPNPVTMSPMPITNPFIPLAPIPIQNPFPMSPPIFPPNGLGPLQPVTFNPYGPTNPVVPAPLMPPIQPLPWGGCDNVIVMCAPIGPIGGALPPPIGGVGGPNFTPHTNSTPVAPVRYKVPRGGHGG